MWVYYLSDLQLDSPKNSPRSLQEVLLMSNAPRSNTHTSMLDQNYDVEPTQVTKPVLSLAQLEQD